MFPTRLKDVKLSHYSKKGDKNNKATYRPILLLISFSKVF
jgi:hypothetical protein